ncbi:MAG: NAD(P)(+) transhydrogenase (Re/Si-specific) subunit beta [Acidobacteriia bacterium]|jgi:NAD(P) transhydrogenase subunit beta|nr:NAD(P)(+) transhydrogenase (Re/Si-specific) subunit beta [Terriglobia bacterium]
MAPELAGSQIVIELVYLIASVLFIFSLKWMSSPTTARHGIWAGEIGMLLAICGTLLHHGIVDYRLIAIGLVLGTIIGIPLGRVAMTAVPQRTALSHAFGALCVTLVGSAEYYLRTPSELPPFMMAVLSLEVILGGLTVTGSLMAAGKLQEILPQRPLTYKGQNLVNFALLACALAIAVSLVRNPGAHSLFPFMILIALAFGVLLIIPIGGADMPTVISLLNGYAGLSAAAMGFVLNSKLLIIAGALDGSSGLILSIIMSKAMNRSFTNVLFGAFGQVQTSHAAEEAKPVRSATPEEAAAILSAANRVIVVPGYGMAVAQAQHKVRELYDGLTKRGVDVRFAIHPVAGRMPGHMNVLLAEADIPYDRLVEMDEINGDFPQTDVALVIGANDVTNPAARSDTTSPIYGMPILDVDKAHTVMVIKRSMNPGFAGIDNPLYYLDNTLMLFGDAKAFVGSIVRELGGGHG